MKKIAFLGMGEMGSRMASHLHKAGYPLTIWNRSSSKLDAFVDTGIHIASTPAEAAADADIVFSMVRDDTASQQVWLDNDTGALASMKEGAIGVECSTLSLPYVNSLNDAFKNANIEFIDAPLAGSRPQADAAALIFFVGGQAPAFESIQPVLEKMGQHIHHAGEAGAGTIVKLMVNALFGAQLACLGELIGMASKTSIDVENALRIIHSTPVCSPAAAMSSKAMHDGLYAPAFPIDLVSKDFQLILDTEDHLNAKNDVSASIKSVFDQAIERGFAQDNITGIVQLFR